MTSKPQFACLRCASRRLETHPPRQSPRHIRQANRSFSRSAYLSSDTVLASERAKAELESAHKYCLDLVRKYDRPSYTLSTFIPQRSRNFHLALRALNISLSLIPDTTSTPTIGLMRLQFWRDTITRTLSGQPPKEPIAILLASAISDLSTRTDNRARISKSWFLRMINAREQYLTNTPYTSLSTLESYAENTYSTLLYLTLASLPLTSLTADHLASHIGKAAGITTVLRGIPLIAFPPPPNHHSNQPGTAGAARTGAITLPLDVMAEAGVKEEDVFRHGADAPGLRDAVFTVATRASDHLITARQMLVNLRAGREVGHAFEHEGEEGHEYDDDIQGGAGAGAGVSRQLEEVERAFGVLMPAVSTGLWLERLQGVDFDVFRTELRVVDWRLPWRGYWGFRRRMF